MRSVELFAGAGGLALGCEAAGFDTQVMVEWNKWACDTVRQNQAAGYPLVRDWLVHEGDVRAFDWESVNEPVDLVSGGPPCQPFSMGGKHGAANDPRDMFPATAEVIARLRPRAFIVENVRGLTRATFANYYQYVLLRLELPLVTALDGESWYDHFLRLQAEATTPDSRTDLRYRVVPTVVNAADYGVPQHRHRVFIVGFRSDVDAEWSFPEPTHNQDALLYSKWVTGEYWDAHKVPRRHRTEPPPGTPRVSAYLWKMNSVGFSPWQTVRDALVGLPEPRLGGSRKYKNHVYQPGARQYKGHTGSALDAPAKALKAGGHGVPGGENMMVRDDGTVRYFTIRESARLQTFPDDYELHGSWGEAMRQIGNAVPVELAKVVATSVRVALTSSERASGDNEAGGNQ
ncbi:MAG: DNA (cytosine-5-)-methyltransferase [Actinobacteria bacterium]|nr:DNA (cytosine-5-)-methyltransferase [Actinomycetota bacterium]